MKRIIQKIFLVILCIVIAVGAVGAYKLFYNPQKNDKITVTDVYGSTYLAVVDDKGTTLAVVTDAEGNRYAAEYNNGEVGSTLGNINDQIAAEDLPTNFTGTTFEATADVTAYTGDVQTTTSSTTQTTTEVTTTTTTTNTQQGNTTTQPTTEANKDPNALEAYRIKKYIDVFSGGTYLMTATTNDPSFSEPFTMAMKNGDVYLETKIEVDEETGALNCKILILDNGETIYLIIDDIKKYFKVPADLIGEDMDMASMMADFGNVELGEIKVSEVEIGGQKLILESYVSPEDGMTVNYYFDGDILVRKDNISKDGTVDSTFFSKVTTDVPDSTFDVPDGYGYFNVSWIGALL